MWTATGELSWISPASGPIAAMVAHDWDAPGPVTGVPTANEPLNPVTMLLPLVVLPSTVPMKFNDTSCVPPVVGELR